MEWLYIGGGLLALGIIIFLVWQDNGLSVTRHSIKNKKIPPAFNGFTLVHISDFHNKNFGKGQGRILKKIREASPDALVLTGDLIDRRRFKLQCAMTFIRGAVKVAPVYYVPGNHEAWCGRYEEIKAALKKAGVTVLENTVADLVQKGDSISVAGVLDPGFYNKEHSKKTDLSDFSRQVARLSQPDRFRMLLSHRPELFSLYVKGDFDLVFTGHAHGGQFRIPGIGGVFAPSQGFFPRYTSGTFREGKTTMVVSRGLGNSRMPIRIFNRPEIVVVTLKSFS